VPRFYFNIQGPVDVCDTLGIGLANLQAARRHAFQLYATATDQRLISLSQEWRMEVTDDAGRLLFHLDFTIANARAVQRLVG
jgi:hypothetical protein